MVVLENWMEVPYQEVGKLLGHQVDLGPVQMVNGELVVQTQEELVQDHMRAGIDRSYDFDHM